MCHSGKSLRQKIHLRHFRFAVIDPTFPGAAAGQGKFCFPPPGQARHPNLLDKLCSKLVRLTFRFIDRNRPSQPSGRAEKTWNESVFKLLSKHYRWWASCWHKGAIMCLERLGKKFPTVLMWGLMCGNRWSITFRKDERLCHFETWLRFTLKLFMIFFNLRFTLLVISQNTNNHKLHCMESITKHQYFLRFPRWPSWNIGHDNLFHRNYPLPARSESFRCQ